ncbi:hypothetical protein T484DRAFT_1876037, partial [Baffinella frigidus]
MPLLLLARKAHGPGATITLVILLMLILPARAPDPWRSAACEALLGRRGDSEAASAPPARIVSPVTGTTVAGDEIRVDFSILEGGDGDGAGTGFPSLPGSGVVAAVLLDGALVAYGVRLGKPLLLAHPPQAGGAEHTLALAAVSGTGSSTWKSDTSLCILHSVTFRGAAEKAASKEGGGG